MGMFDYIKCQKPLPPSDKMPPNGALFQTKDTPDQYLTVYTITADGRLSWHPYREEEVPIEERPDPKFPIIGSVRRIEQEAEIIPFHGDIFFYTGTKHDWWEYRARFTENVCAEIILIEYKSKALTT